MDDIIIRERIAVPGPSGHTITAPDYADVKNRLAVVEDVAEAFNTVPIPPGVMISTVSHGIGYPHTPAPITMQPSWMVWTPIAVPRDVDVDAMGVHVETAQSGAQLTLLGYDRNGVLVENFGTISADTTGWHFTGVAVAQTLIAGLSYVAVKINATSGVVISGHVPRHYIHHDPSMNNKGSIVQTGTGDTPPATAIQSTYIYQTPYLAVQVRA